MGKVFVSFLGIGKTKQTPGYDKAIYNWPGKSETKVKVCFAQTAILKILEEKAKAEGPVNKAIIFCTEESEKKHLQRLRNEFQDHLRNPPHLIVPRPLVPTEMNADNQWGWFEQLLKTVQQNDTLIIDFTHGMRAVPIVFSSAIGFLQKAKGVTLAHALYAWYDMACPEKVHPIVDMREFYVINDWAEAVSRLTDDADTRKLGELAATTKVKALRSLNDKALIHAFAEMTDCIRNIDVNHVGEKVGAALDKINQTEKRATGSAQVMLRLVRDKFGVLGTSPSSRYDRTYFNGQLEIIRVLLEHRLFMQAYTAMRELLGSIGMAGLLKEKAHQIEKTHNSRYNVSQAFFWMLRHSPEKWDNKDPQIKISDKQKEALKQWLGELGKAHGLTDKIKHLVGEVRVIRNGFDHAWTNSQTGARQDIKDNGDRHLEQLKKIIDQMIEEKLLS